jgi:hypothetical protein
MDSFPMLARCWERQWAGLGPKLQDMLRAWPLDARGLMARFAYPREQALWTVRYGRPVGERMILISVKADDYGGK